MTAKPVGPVASVFVRNNNLAAFVCKCSHCVKMFCLIKMYYDMKPSGACCHKIWCKS